jgi:hypothetical protein
MASYTAARVKSATLTGTTVDDVTLAGVWPRVEVLNRGTGTISFTVNGTTPTALGDNCYVVLPNTSLTVPTDSVASSTAIKLIGNGDAYTVTGVR